MDMLSLAGTFDKASEDARVDQDTSRTDILATSSTLPSKNQLAGSYSAGADTLHHKSEHTVERLQADLLTTGQLEEMGGHVSDASGELKTSPQQKKPPSWLKHGPEGLEFPLLGYKAGVSVQMPSVKLTNLTDSEG